MTKKKSSNLTVTFTMLLTFILCKGIELLHSSIYCFKSLSRYSKTRVNDFSVWIISCKVTEIFERYTLQNAKFHFFKIIKFLPIFACLSSFSSDTSLMAVHGAPSSCSKRISLSATRLSVNLDFPLNTVAYVPCEKKIKKKYC